MRKRKKNAVPLMDKPALTVDEACEIAGVSRSILYKAMTCDLTLRARKLGSRRIILRSDLDTWLQNLPPANP